MLQLIKVVELPDIRPKNPNAFAPFIDIDLPNN